MRRVVLSVVVLIVAVAGTAGAAPAIQVTDPCGDARMSVRIDESTTQPTGSLSDAADVAALGLANDAGSVLATMTTCGPAVAPVDAGPNVRLTWWISSCLYTLRLSDVTGVTIERAVERWNSATLESSCSAGNLELDWADDVRYAGNQITIRFEKSDLGAFASILDPGTEWQGLGAETSAAVSRSGGTASALERVWIESHEGRDTAGPGWGFVVNEV